MPPFQGHSRNRMPPLQPRMVSRQESSPRYTTSLDRVGHRKSAAVTRLDSRHSTISKPCSAAISCLSHAVASAPARQLGGILGVDVRNRSSPTGSEFVFKFVRFCIDTKRNKTIGSRLRAWRRLNSLCRLRSQQRQQEEARTDRLFIMATSWILYFLPMIT